MFDLVTIGHTARDEFEGEPEWRIGGTATYAAAAAACLGDRVALLTRVSVTGVSEEDIEGDLDLARGWARTAPVIVTIAERGAIVLRGGREVEVGGFPANEVVDQTGAGDAFCAGLALGLADGDDLEAASRFANAVASFAVEGVGTAALASREQVQARMSGHSSSTRSSSSSGAPPGRTTP